MSSSREVEWWVAVYEAIRQIPPGQVTTYKHIAVLVGTPNRARQVGICLSSLPQHSTQQAEDGANTSLSVSSYDLSNVPWQRVINSKGMISHRAPGWAHRQAQYLRREGVHVDADGMGEHYISLTTYGWFPNQLALIENGGDGEGEGQGDN
ncbi:MGMT family protein [Xylogone sp. PMI_703]|nr:MGMT family protein [Xylogone sp. PMI_703]